MISFKKVGSSILASNISEFINGITNLIFPKKSVCIFCKKPLLFIEEHEICKDCMSKLMYLSPPLCDICGKPLADLNNLCQECKCSQIYFEKAASVFHYAGLIQSMIYRLKYDGDKDIACPIGLFMSHEVKGRGWHRDLEMIIPVPLHAERLYQRGFNQSLLLSEIIGRECRLDVRDDILKRIRYTESQINFSKFDRIINVKNAFYIENNKSVINKKILIVDDIMTTGATLNECSRILKQAGAKEVYCITVACPYHI